jgi:multicomponent Na+:H+ antiporter subunit F
VFNFFFIVIALAVLVGLIRFVKGPTSSDRVVALDTLTTIISSLLVLSALFFKSFILLDISFVFAALSFTSVIIIARYFEGRS